MSLILFDRKSLTTSDQDERWISFDLGVLSNKDGTDCKVICSAESSKLTPAESEAWARSLSTTTTRQLKDYIKESGRPLTLLEMESALTDFATQETASLQKSNAATGMLWYARYVSGSKKMGDLIGVMRDKAGLLDSMVVDPKFEVYKEPATKKVVK